MKRTCLTLFLTVLFIFSITTGASALTLRYGSRGSEVKRVQERLISLGYLNGRADGIFGSQTRSAVIRFQKNSGLKADGIVGNATMGKLFGQQVSQPSQNTPAPASPQIQTSIQRTLKQGSRGSDVAVLQRRLNDLGFNCGTPDGSFGPKTKQAVMNFQRSRGLKVDGIVGKMTIAKLFEGMVDNNNNNNNNNNNTPNHPSEKAPEEKVSYHGQADALKGKAIILDAGHGGADSGANRSGVYEKDINLDITMRLKRMLEEAGAKVVLTRDNDSTHSLFNRSAIANNYVLCKELEVQKSELAELNKSKKEKEDLKAQKEAQLQQANISRDANNKTLMDKQDLLGELNSQLSDLQQKLIQAEAENNAGLVQELKTQIENLKGQIDTLNKEIEKIQGDAASLDVSIAALEDEIKVITGQIAAFETQISSKQAAIDEINNKINLFKPYLDNPNNDERSGIYRYNDNSGELEYRNSDLAAVFDLEKKYHGNIIFISIHVNSTGESETAASGIQVYYRGSSQIYRENRPYYNGYDDEGRRSLASNILQQINAISDFSYKYTSPIEADLSVLRENNLVSSLIEIGFINNSRDRELLLKENTREKAAYGIYKGIVEYFRRLAPEN